MECAPGTKVEVVNAALPPLSVPDPSVDAPSLNVTVPGGVPDPDVTLAVKVTAAPYVDGFREEATEVAVFAATAKLTNSVLSTLPAPSVLWKLTVWLPSEGTAKGPAYVRSAPPSI